MPPRLPAHLEVSGLLRQVSAAGGFAAVLHKGEREAGTILVVCTENGSNRRLYERMPSADGTRNWTLVRSELTDIAENLDDYLNRRMAQDPDLWIIELDIANGERFIGLAGTND
jgi:hypothetical protein